MAGFNPQTGQYDPNYTPDFASLSNYGNGVNVAGYDPNSTGLPTFIPSYGAAPSAGAVSVAPKTPIAPVTVPQPQFGWNLDTLKTGLGVAQTGANIWSAFQQAALAKDQLAFAKQIGQANLANQMKSYNSALSDRAAMDAKVGGWTPEQTAAYIAANKLTGK